MMSAEKKHSGGLSGGEKFLIFLYLYLLMFVFGGLEFFARVFFA